MRRDEGVSAPIRVVSYNVRYFSHALCGLASSRRSIERIAAAIATLAPRPQIICLQEVEARSLRSRAMTDDETQLERFDQALARACARRGDASHYRAIYFPAHVAGAERRPLYTTGLAILVDQRCFSIAAHELVALTKPEDRGERRICAHVELRLLGPEPSPSLHVFNVHLSLPAPLLRARLGHGANQLAQAARLAEFVRARAKNAPRLVCGDYNSTAESPALLHLVDAAQLARLPACTGPTSGVGPLRWQLDHLFIGGGADWVDFEGTHAFGDRESAFHGLSDHAPLVARLCMPLPSSR
jgi:endonuclease/exonuclease/phosphatase family metal-dependent hydrolase